MSVAMIGPKFYARSRDDKPLAFGKLYTYQAQTNTPKPTYQSEDQVVENTNPVILNGEGYANIYLSGSYKMVLKDADENEIWSADPVTASQPNEWVNCLTATYASPISFKVSGNLTAEYEVNRSVRINNGALEYAYSVIVDSSYALGETTVIVSDSFVTTGIIEVCSSIVGPNSATISSLKIVALSKGVLDSEVISSADKVTVLDDIIYIYDSPTQKTWLKPALNGNGEKIVNFVDGTLTTTGGTYVITEAKTFAINLLTPNQNLNVLGSTGDPLPGSTPTDYDLNKEIAAGWKVLSKAEEITYISGVLNSANNTGVVRRSYDRDPAKVLTNETLFGSVIDGNGIQVLAGTLLDDGVAISVDANQVHIDWDFAVLSDGIRFPQLSTETGIASSISDKESMDEWYKGDRRRITEYKGAIAFDLDSVAWLTEDVTTADIIVGGTGWTKVNFGGIGINQTVQDLTSSRVSNQTYTNTTDSPISVYITPADDNLNSTLTVNKPGETPVVFGRTDLGSNFLSGMNAIVPVGYEYEHNVSAINTLFNWSELR